VAEALERCPDIALQIARPARYLKVHKLFLDAIATCIPHGKAASVDEVPCWLVGRERQRENAEGIARSIKRAMRERFSESLTCSIGIAPNKFLAKTASDMNKPDGLTVIEQTDLPHALHGLELRDLCGIGPSMEARLHRAGIETIEQLCASSRDRLRRAWGSIEGERFWLQLRGFDLPERESRRASIGHSHVLGPELRSFEGARSVLCKLLAKAAMRLRHEGFLAGGMAIRMRFVGRDERFEHDLRFAALDDTPALLRMLGGKLELLQGEIADGSWDPKRHPPLSVAVTLTGLSPRIAVGGELMAERQRAHAISALLDRVNEKFGQSALHTGSMRQAVRFDAAPMRIPFGSLPDVDIEEETRLHGIDQAPTEVADLLRVRINQFNVLAEKTHRERARRHRPSGAGGWNTSRTADSTPPQARMF
jgi:DNA polymerase-4